MISRNLQCVALATEECFQISGKFHFREPMVIDYEGIAKLLDVRTVDRKEEFLAKFIGKSQTAPKPANLDLVRLWPLQA